MRVHLLNYEFPPFGGGARLATASLASHLASKGEPGDAAPALPHRRPGGVARGALRVRPGVAAPGVRDGAADDHLELPDGRRLSPYALTCALEEIPGMLRYQVIQLERDRLRVRARMAAASPAARARIEDAVRRGAGSPLRVEVEFVESFTPGPNPKFRVVQPAPAAEA